MAKLPFPIFGREPFEDQNVFTFGKRKELYAADFEGGIARIGGLGRHPHYFFTYLLGAKTLVNDSRASGTYDDLGLPAFYLQRHATELLLKRLLEWCHHLVEVESATGNFDFSFTNKEIERLSRSHNLSKLFADLERVTAALGHNPPEEIGLLVRAICKYEITETFARYSSSEKGETVIRHVEEEVALPVVELQALLDRTAKVSLFQMGQEESFELTLHNAWQEKTFYDLP